VVNIPYYTFKQYTATDHAKRRKVGNQVGREALLPPGDQQEFLADVLARKDRANNGADPKEAVDKIQELNHGLSRSQARDHLNRTLLPNHPTMLKPKPRVAQQTTTKRSAITLIQQFRWHTTYEHALNELRRLNTGVCRLTGKTFGEVIHHFITGGNETCFSASEDRSVRVIASANKTKHEKKTAHSRVSITMYRTGSVAGDTGPTVFLLEGKHRKSGFTDAWLREHGSPEGSIIVMTPNAFMTIEAWEKMTPSVCKGLRNINAIVTANSQWHMLEIFDGFGAHLSSLKAMQLRANSKISSLKEEGDSSHVNQAYDRFMAKSDKSAKGESIAMLRNAKQATKGVIDQWGLIHVGLYAVRAARREAWTRSFEVCNLDPRTRLSFPDWAKKIEGFLQAGQSFKIEGGELDTYPLLPSFWQGMTPDDKKKVVAVIKQHGGYSVDCLKELHSQCHIELKQMQNVRVCVECASKNPEQLDMGVPDPSTVAAIATSHDLGAASAAVNDVWDGLDSFQLKPKSKTGIELLNHMVQKRCCLQPEEADVP